MVLLLARQGSHRASLEFPAMASTPLEHRKQCLIPRASMQINAASYAGWVSLLLVII